MKPPSILCYHCGRDYAHEYWTMGLKADPRVCKGCRRDLNPDAVDAPRWIPEAPRHERARVQQVSRSLKRCRMCGGEWEGFIFGPSASKGSPPPFGVCPACSDADAARRGVVPSPSLETLAAPRRVFGYED